MKKYRKIGFGILVLAILQAVLLMNMPTAQSYFIAESSSEIATSVNVDEENKILKTGLNLLIGFLSIKEIGIVSATDFQLNCCLKTKDGAICQDVLSTDADICDGNLVAASCDRVAECRSGCCIDEDEGLCSTKSPKAECENDGGIWKGDENCLIQECSKGCCVVGNQALFATEKRCEMFSALYGFEKDFRGMSDEITCLMLSATQFEGACVVGNNSCARKTETECVAIGGAFSQGLLCSNPSLNSGCKKQDSIGCFEGKDEIYWFDSCGNRENIYSSDKTSSWNGGKILNKGDSCGAGENNANSRTCGNCDYFLGSKCSTSSVKKVRDGNYVCGDMSCVDENGDPRKNGESWCVYDGYIGDGKDVVGSRHWRRMCIDGEIKVEPCADYRGQVCSASVLEQDGEEFSTSACVINEALKCIDYNNDEEMEKLCNDNTHCEVRNIDVDDYFKFSVCTPKYPRGFTVDDPGMAGTLCSIATTKCTTYWEKVEDWDEIFKLEPVQEKKLGHLGKYKCIENCNCLDSEFEEQLSDLCISLGDCGSYVNYIGKGTNNAFFGKAGIEVDWRNYKDYVGAVDGQNVDPQNESRYILAFDGEFETDESSSAKIMGTMSQVSGVGGLVATILPFVFKTAFAEGGSFYFLAPYLTVIGCASMGMALGGYMAMWMQRSGRGALYMMIGGTLAGAGIGILIVAGVSNFWNPVGWVLLIIGVVAILVTAVEGFGKTKEVDIKFTCLPWQAPLGGKDCGKCDDDAMKPCSQYRCESLGQACKLLNANTENSVCEAIADDGKDPQIINEKSSSGYELIDKSSVGVEMRRDDGGCIPEFTNVNFTFDTDEFAQCRVSMERTSKYDDMLYGTMEQNLFSEGHTIPIMMPSLDSLSVYDVSGDVRKMFGNFDVYIRCQDYYGNANSREYVLRTCIESGPDLTPAYITRMVPENAILKYGENEINATFYTNEPANCKYDDEPGKDYFAMESEMDCETDIERAEMYGWRCDAGMKNLQSDENKIYIKCRDAPWLGENSSRNINVEDFVYTVKKSLNPLKIKSISPSGEVEAGVEPISIDLEVETSGGAEDNGKAVCYFKFSENSEYIESQTTGLTNHKQVFDKIVDGKYRISVMCEDVSGNVAEGEAVFTAKLDTSAPVVVRVLKEGNNLKVVTNEEAECYYSEKKCYFNFANASSMTTLFSTVHTVKWDSNIEYHVKCKDIWGNANDGCAIIVKPGEF